MAAAVHDLGKIVIPYAILNKSGPMSDPEMAIIRMHPGTAYDILKNIDFPWPLAETIYQHHERLDGSGYPRGLKGDEILMEARILGGGGCGGIHGFFSVLTDLPWGWRRPNWRSRAKKASFTIPRLWMYCLLLLNEKGFDFQTKTWKRSITEKSPRN